MLWLFSSIKNFVSIFGDLFYLNVDSYVFSSFISLHCKSWLVLFISLQDTIIILVLIKSQHSRLVSNLLQSLFHLIGNENWKEGQKAKSKF